MGKLAIVLALLAGTLFGMIMMSLVLTKNIETMEIGLTEIHQMEMETLEIKLDDMSAQLDAANIDRDNLQVELDDMTTSMEWVFNDKEWREEFLTIWDMCNDPDRDDDEFDRRIEAFEQAIFEGTGIQY